MHTLTQSFFRPFGVEAARLPAFHAAYLMLAVIAAAMFPLGFFALLIAIHMALDFYKCRNARAVFRESLMDLTLLFLALTACVYLSQELSMIAVLTGSARTYVTLMRGFAVLLAKLTILHHSLRILFHVETYLHTRHAGLHVPWSKTESLCLAIIVISVLSIVFAPAILPMDASDLRDVLMRQVRPWKV